MIQRVKGTQDFIDLTLFNFIFKQSKKHLLEYNFSEIIVPVLENIELFKRTLGLHTDVVNKEMFIVQPKNNEDESICLRPEATAPVVRAFVENNIEQIPWKAFTYGPMFRYERPQKGRYRQFNQISIEIIGSKAINQDALLIKMLDQLFKKKFLLDNYAILVNFLGCYQDRSNFNEILKKFLETVSDKICQNCNDRKDKNPLRIFDCKNPECQEVYKNAPTTTDHLCPECANEWKLLTTTMELISISFKHAKNLVRGLDYYDKTVFEFVSSNLGAQNAFCAGGRYDRLVHDISQKIDQPAVGAAIGVERLMLLIEPIKDKLAIEPKAPLYLILPLSEKQQLLGLLISNQLHFNNITCDILLDESSVKNLMRKANKLGAKFVLIIGDDEQNSHEVTIKNMVTGQEERIKQTELVNYIQQKQ